MNQKTGEKRKPHANVYAASTWPGGAQAWMDVAVRLDVESGRSRANDHINHHKLNVAHVCTGLAFELAYKSLLVAEFKLPEKTHSIEKLHKMLKEKTKRIVGEWIKKAGWKESVDLLKYLDERMANPDRKYWMDNPWKTAKTGVSQGTSFVIAIGIMTIPELAPISYKLVNLGAENLTKARKRLYLIECTRYTYLPKGEVHLAIKDYTKAIEQDPEFAEIYHDRAIVWLHLQEWQEAKADLSVAKVMEVDIAVEFYNRYKSIADFEQKIGIQLPPDIAAMLTPLQA